MMNEKTFGFRQSMYAQMQGRLDYPDIQIVNLNSHNIWLVVHSIGITVKEEINEDHERKL